MFLSEVLAHTPWWVFLVFFYFLKVSIDALKPRVFKFKKLFIFPAVFLGLTVQSAFFKGTPNLFNGMTLVFFLILGSFLGWKRIKSSQIKFDHTKDLIQVPGSAMTMVLFLALFSAKYFIGYTQAVNPEAVTKLGFMIFQNVVYGISSGLLLGRLIKYLIIKVNAPHHELTKAS